MTKEEVERRMAKYCGLSLEEYRRRRDELLKQVSDLKGT